VVEASPRPGRVVWLRLQTELADEGRWYVRLERTPIRRVALLLPEQPAIEQVESRYFRLGQWMPVGRTVSSCRCRSACPGR